MAASLADHERAAILYCLYYDNFGFRFYHGTTYEEVLATVDACRADGSKKEHYVRVSVKGLSDAVEVRIEDNGIGMTEETRTKLFTLFFSSKGKGGTGIGLYVARQVVMQHGGRIEVASVKGEGSTFTVTMPRILAK